MSKSEEGHVTHFVGAVIAEGAAAGIKLAEVPKDKFSVSRWVV